MSFFKRINFFKGLFTSAEDWTAEQNYHINKQRLHSRTFHSPGVVFGEGANLNVIVGKDGKLIVERGYAVDAQGRDLYLPESRDLVVKPDATEQKEIYIFIAFGEDPIELRHSRLNAEDKEHAFVLERPLVDWTDQPPDNQEKIELARITWKPGQQITADDIKRNHVKNAGTRQSGSIASKVTSGELELSASAHVAFSDRDPTIGLEAFDDEKKAAGTVYLSTVFPIPSNESTDARIFWRIESSINNQNKIQYHLLLKNFGTKKVMVCYAVYRLNLGGLD